MQNRIKQINQKRTTLKAQITNLEKILREAKLDPTNIKARFNKVKELFTAYEDLHDELALLVDQESEYLAEFSTVQDAYYDVLTKVENSYPTVNATPNATENANAAASHVPTTVINNNASLPKLPVTDLPKFNGDIEKWLSFKNTFVAMVDSRDDIPNLQKLIYLLDCLQDDALNKISIYEVSEENYATAWELLIDSYDKKRILVAKHLDAILELPIVTKATHKSLTRLVDSMRQHINMLASLQIKPDEHLLVRIMERKLPEDVRSKWEETLNLNECPSLDKLYKFVSEAAFRLYTREQDYSHSKHESSKKRSHSGPERGDVKRQKTNHGNKYLLATEATAKCVVCNKEKHFAYQCSEFRKMSVSQRWNFVKKSTLCKNCLRHHDDKCKWSHCKKCTKFHNTLLHNDNARTDAKPSTSQTSDVKQEGQSS